MVCAESSAIPIPAMTACLIVSLLPISMRGPSISAPNSRRIRSRVPEPGSRNRKVSPDSARRDRPPPRQGMAGRGDDHMRVWAEHGALHREWSGG